MQRPFRRMFLKVVMFDVAILVVLVVLSVLFITRSKMRLAGQLAETFRAPLVAGDNRQIILDMPRPVLKDFRGFIWRPSGKGYSFSVPVNLGPSNKWEYDSFYIKVFFDENQTIEAGRLLFIFNRWEALPIAVFSWLLLVSLSILIGYYEWKRIFREYELSLESQINESRANFAAQVAHDIRSPLFALDAALKDTAELPEKKRIIVRHAVNRIRDVANDLLEKNRQQAKTGPAVDSAGESPDAVAPLETYLISSVIDPLITEKRLQFESNPGINIDFELTRESYGLFAKLQPVEFRRMISNLVNNAVEALGDKGAVSVGLTNQDQNIILTVSDNGKGIPAEIRARLGQKGETHGKTGGSGLGLFHAITTAESWGGSLVITSELGKGSKVTIKLPKAKAPDEFVPELILYPGRPVVVLDDDPSVHQIWQGRFESARVKEHDIEVFHFNEPEKLRAWVKANPAKSVSSICLFDYELSGYKETGLSLAEELGLCGQTILVTSRCEEKRIIEECRRLKVRMIPKGLSGFVPMTIAESKSRDISSVSASSSKFAILVDDDALTHMTWEMAAQEHGIKLQAYTDPAEFLSQVGDFSKDTPMYIDSDLGENIKGEDIAADLRKKGFTNLCLATGHPPERFSHLPWLKVISKEPPWG